jgi:hypothetical protein
VSDDVFPAPREDDCRHGCCKAGDVGVSSELLPDLWVCDPCRGISTQHEATRHASTAGHPRKLTPAEAHALRDLWEQEGRDRATGARIDEGPYRLDMDVLRRLVEARR